MSFLLVFLLMTGIFVIFMYYGQKMFKIVIRRTNLQSKKDESPVKKFHAEVHDKKSCADDLNPLLSSEPIVISQSDW